MDAKKHAAKVEAAQKTKKAAKPSAPAKQTASGAVMNFPMEFCVTVEGEDFNVSVNSLGSESGEGSVQESGTGTKPKRGKEDSPGAIKPMMAGMVVSIKVTPDQVINQGEQIATIEAMKMLRDVNSPHAGIVKKIFFEEGEMLDSDDILMIVEPNNE
jgi:biotin carboxyl carrier protein